MIRKIAAAGCLALTLVAAPGITQAGNPVQGVGVSVETSPGGIMMPSGDCSAAVGRLVQRANGRTYCELVATVADCVTRAGRSAAAQQACRPAAAANNTPRRRQPAAQGSPQHPPVKAVIPPLAAGCSAGCARLHLRQGAPAASLRTPAVCPVATLRRLHSRKVGNGSSVRRVGAGPIGWPAGLAVTTLAHGFILFFGG